MRGAVLDGRYELTERLGRGGMGQVWSARDGRMQREVAVKLVTAFPDAGEEETFLRFRREIRSAANLPGRHTVTAHDCGEAVIDDEPVLYMVMERLTGRTLAQEIRRERPHWRTAVGWASQVATALHAAHTLRIVHRDIKPENVMFAADGDVKVLDFGIAKFLGDTARAGGLTRTGVPMGTLLYMSPEQARGDTDVDHRTDLYSLGCLLYFMLTGRPPMVADNVLALVYMHAEAQIPPPQALVPAIPSGLGALVMQLLQRRPADRPGSAGAVLERLKELGASRHLGVTTTQVPAGDRAEAEVAAKLAGARDIYQAAMRDASAREAEAEAVLDEARRRADEMLTDAHREAGVLRAEAERHRTELRHRTEQEILALRTRGERETRDRRAEADALVAEVREQAAQAAAEFETALAKRREQAERDLAAQRATAEKRVAELEHRAEQLSLESERLRTEAEERARRTLQSAQRQVENVLRDGDAKAAAARAEEERAMNSLTELRGRVTRMLADSSLTPLDDLAEQRAEILGRLSSLRDALLDIAVRRAAAHGYADGSPPGAGATDDRRSPDLPAGPARPARAPGTRPPEYPGETDAMPRREARRRAERAAEAERAPERAGRAGPAETRSPARPAGHAERPPESQADRTELLRHFFGRGDGSEADRPEADRSEADRSELLRHFFGRGDGSVPPRRSAPGDGGEASRRSREPDEDPEQRQV